MRIHILAMLLVTCIGSIAQAATCPLNRLGIGSVSGALRTSALPIDSYGQGPGSGAYNVPAGTLSVHMARCSVSPECGSSADIVIVDDFSVTGPPAGTPVPLTAHMSAHLTSYFSSFSYSFTHAILRDAFGGVQDVGGDGDHDVALPVAAVVGQTFRLEFELSGSSLSGDGGGSAVISFSGPAGTTVTSCQGYVSPVAVTTRPMSWGKLKTHYR